MVGEIVELTMPVPWGSDMTMVRQAQRAVKSRWRAIRGSFGPGTFVPALVSRTQLFQAAKVAVAAGIAWAVALAVYPNGLPYLAPLAVLLIVQPTVYDSLSRAFQRVIGVVLGVAAALAVSHFLTPSGWSIAIIIFVGLLLGWSVRLGPQGVVQVPVSALLVFAVGSATPGYGGRRVVDTLIGSAIAVLAVLASPSAPAPERVVSDALAPLRQCRDLSTTSDRPSVRHGPSNRPRSGGKTGSDWSRPPLSRGGHTRGINSLPAGMRGPVDNASCSSGQTKRCESAN